jgi:2-polyprenyl-3-methyl-5-hydroxy-6-metoxy-1,4-benzoquinol methylase
VLDAGCGTGENALYLASLGLSVLAVDVAKTALAIAREMANARVIEAEFVTADAFHLQSLGRMFTTVLDCGLFHLQRRRATGIRGEPGVGDPARLDPVCVVLQ